MAITMAATAPTFKQPVGRVALFANLVASLTPRQQYIVGILGLHDTVRDAADALGMSAAALSRRLPAISVRLGLPGPTELVNIARRHAILDAVPHGLYGVDPNGVCVFANAAAAQLFGYERADLVGREVHPMLHHSRSDGSAYPLEECPINQVLRNPRSIASGSDVFWHRDGSPVWVTYTVQPAGDEAAAMAVIMVRDRTSEHRSEEELSIRDVRWELALAAAGMVAFRIDLTTGASITSGNFADLLGLSPEDEPATFDEFLQHVHPEDRAQIDIDAYSALLPGTMYTSDFRLRHRDGNVRHFRGRVQVVTHGLGRDSTLLGVAVDITDRIETEEANRLLLELSTDGFIGMSQTGTVTLWNPAAERIFDWRAQEALGRPLADLVIPARYRPAHLRALQRMVDEPLETVRSRGPIELRAMRADGAELDIEATLATVPTPRGPTFRAFVRDISDRKHLERELLRHAVTDELTGLPNRALLVDRLDRAVSRLNQVNGGAAVLFVDLDRFKVINDSLGHSVGDDVLRQAAARLARSIRAVDTVARFGGDEFVVVCDGITEHEATGLAQRLLDAVRAPLELHGRELALTASIGVAFTLEPCLPEDLLRDADAAMFRAKEHGRNRYEMFDREMRQRALDRLEMENALRRAIERDELTLLYQPIVGIEDGRISGVEALVRWDRPGIGRVGPDSFIPLAEEIGTIVPIGQWVVRTACAQLAEWTALSAQPLRMAVNLSARQLMDSSVVEVVRAAVAHSGVDPSQLCIEVTETALVEDTQAAAAALRELKDIGIRIAVDDFGTGYSSMLHLRQFPVDILKMDRAFVAGITRDEQDRTIVEATIGLAHALGHQTVAEGVEEPEQLDMLRELGCDLAQGFLWSRPVEPAALEHLVRNGLDRRLFDSPPA